MNYQHLFCLCALVFHIYIVKKSDALNCSQCNIRFLGVHNLCRDPRNATNCIGCMKSVAKVKLRDSGYMDGWERMSVVISRACITLGNINVKPAGCYKQQNNGGYTERCYCYTDNCNSAAARPTLSFFSTFFSSAISFSYTSTVAIVISFLLFALK